MRIMADDTLVRIGHCSPDAPNVDISVDGDIAFEDVAFKTISDYAELPAGSHEVAIAPHGEGDAVLETTLELEENTNYSVFATGMVDDDLQVTVLTDEPGVIPEDQAHVRFVHCSPDAPAVDIRVANDGPMLFENVSFRTASGYTPVDAGTYDIEAVPTGTDEVTLSLPDTAFEGGTAVSAIAIGRVADDSLTVILAEDARAAMPAEDD